MTLTDALLGAAALWLLIVICGFPGHRSRGPESTWDDASLAWPESRAPVDAVAYAVGHLEVPEPRRVTPPMPDKGDASGTARDFGLAPIVPVSRYDTLGSATVYAAGLPQVLNLAEVTIAPGEVLSLADREGSALIVLNAGRLERTEWSGNAVLTQSALVGPVSAVQRGTPSLPVVASRDRIAFGRGATVVLHNWGDQPARVLTAAIVGMPGFEA